MNPETFFEKFDLFADATDALAKMRELVLQLAVQGNLVDQKIDEGDAFQLISAIYREREARAAKLRTPIEPAPPDGDGNPFQIPSTWAWTQLGTIALQIQYGYTASADPSATDIRMLRITDIQNNRVDWPSVPGCQIEFGEAEKYLLSSNDILIARTGGTIGKSFIVPDAPVKSVFASYLIRITPPRAMEARYLKIFLESPLYWTQLRSMSAGTGQPNVNGQALGRLEIPLPPLAEQKRIVAKVDELMALCDQLEAQQQERETRHAALARASLARFADATTPANLNFIFHKSYDIAPADLRKSILTLAVQGKLVPQDPNDEPVGVTLDASGVDLERWAVSEQEQRHGVPDSWMWLRFAGVGEQRLGKMLDAEKNRGELKPYLRNTNVQWMRFDLDDVKEMRVEEREENDLRLSNGDLLICEGGEPGRCAIWNDQVPEMYFQKALHRVRPCAAILTELLALHLQVDCQNDVLASYFTGATIKHLTGRSLSEYPIPIPPVAEQRRIVAKVDELMTLVDALETQLATARTTAEKLMEAVLAELTA